MRKRVTILMAMATILAGCESRSISNSGYPGDASTTAANGNTAYRGEIDDIALLVPTGDREISDRQIARTLADHHPVVAKIGEPLLVVQSGAIAPDGEMISALQRHFPVIPFNGQPPAQDSAGTAPGNLAVRVSAGDASTSINRTEPAPPTYAQRLRLAAAEGGAAHILVYWGILETAQHNEVTALVSWVPVVGWALPDQSQDMRIRLKAALIDTASGQWRMLTPAPVSDDSLSSGLTRRSSDQGQVALLKQQGYGALAEQLAAAQ